MTCPNPKLPKFYLAGDSKHRNPHGPYVSKNLHMFTYLHVHPDQPTNVGPNLPWPRTQCSWMFGTDQVLCSQLRVVVTSRNFPEEAFDRIFFANLRQERLLVSFDKCKTLQDFLHQGEKTCIYLGVKDVLKPRPNLAVFRVFRG